MTLVLRAACRHATRSTQHEPKWTTAISPLATRPSLLRTPSRHPLAAQHRTVVALILLEPVTRLLLGTVVALGIVFVVLFLVVALLVGLRFALLYWRRRNP